MLKGGYEGLPYAFQVFEATHAVCQVSPKDDRICKISANILVLSLVPA
jgi:hypothetical protein